ncbi:hypothetical protein SLE2022_248120 [Rubroshorea leprosula]
MIREASGPSGKWIQQESTSIVSNVGKNLNNNVSIQTGEEFSMEFLQDRVAMRGIPVVPDTAQIVEKRLGFNQKQNLDHKLAYEDIARLLGLGRMDSECASDISEFQSAKGSLMEIENGSCVESLSRLQEDGDAGHGSRKAFCELNCDRTAGSVPNVPPLYPSDSLSSKNFNGPCSPVVSDRSQSGKIKFLCSSGGKILPRPSDGKLRYVGGETRIISIGKNLLWEELVRKTSMICNQPHSIKYQLPGEDLDALISVSSDEDLQNMIEECHGLEGLGGSQRLRVFLIPLGESENASSIEANTIQQSDPDYQYVIALNGIIIDPSPHKKTGGGQCLTGEISQHGTNLDQNASAPEHSPLLFPLEIGSGFDALHPSKIFNESQNTTRPSHPSPPISPAPLQPGDTQSIPVKLHGDDSSIESSGSFITAQLNSENSSMEAAFIKDAGHAVADLLNHKLPHNKIDRNHPDQLERPMHKESTFLPISHSEDPLSLLSGSIDSVDSYPGMSHAYSDSKLQEQEGSSAYCSQDGMSPSSPLNFAKTQPPSILVSSAVKERSVPLHDNMDLVKPNAQNNFGGNKSSGSQLTPHMLYSQSLDQSGRQEPIHKNPDGNTDQCQAAKIDASKPHLITPSLYGENTVILDARSGPNERDPFLVQLQKLCEGRSPATSMECNKKMADTECNQTINSSIATWTKDVEASWNNVPSSSANDFKCFIENNMDQNQILDRTPSDLLTDQIPATDRCSALGDKVIDGQLSNTSWIRNSEIAGLIPKSRADSIDKGSLPDLITGSSNAPVLQPARSQKATDIKEATLMNSAGLNPPAVLVDSGPTLNLHVNESYSMFQNSTCNATLKREFSLIDDDFISYPDQNVGKLGLGESAYDKSNLEDFLSAQARSSSKIVLHVDVTSTGMISPFATESENVIPESELEDAMADGQGKDESFSEAMINEMEASIYGLQIIRNADLEDLRELGSGTYGTVYHGKWRGTDVAIKRIKKSCFAGRSSEQERLTNDFWREAQILSKLHHPNVVAFYGVVPDGTGGTLATVTEYMVNGSLRNVLLKRDKSLDRRRKLLIALDAAFGMEYLHSKNIVHFDLKCDNLLVNLKDPQRPICKVGDFGLSRIKRNTLVSGGVRGTLPWMAPELLNGSSSRVSEKVDVFSFGISMWEILTGEEPYADMHCGAIIGGILKNTLRPPIPERCDPGWKKLMEQCWSPDPETRPSFTEITNRLRAMSFALQPKGHNT